MDTLPVPVGDGSYRDEPADHDFWYYVAMANDECGNLRVSTVSNGALNYILGDVVPIGLPIGNNIVNGVDISELGDAYGASDGDAFYNPQVDVGPVGLDGVPETDNAINFEDLLVFAINFGQMSRLAGEEEKPVPDEQPELVLDVAAGAAEGGEILTATLVLRDHTTSIKGIHTVIRFDRRALRVSSVSEGALLESQTSPVFFKTLDDDGGVIVDVAALGRGVTLDGSGEVATLRFEVHVPGARPVLSVVDLRDRDNRRVAAR